MGGLNGDREGGKMEGERGGKKRSVRKSRQSIRRVEVCIIMVATSHEWGRPDGKGAAIVEQFYQTALGSYYGLNLPKC